LENEIFTYRSYLFDIFSVVAMKAARKKIAELTKQNGDFGKYLMN